MRPKWILKTDRWILGVRWDHELCELVVGGPLKFEDHVRELAKDLGAFAVTRISPDSAQRGRWRLGVPTGYNPLVMLKKLGPDVEVRSVRSFARLWR